jgi:chemotaxis protein MotB
MIETELSKPKEMKSPLQEIWPPKWFFSYADLAQLLMTFFIILATMLSLKIPLAALSNEKLKTLLRKEKIQLVEIGKLTVREKTAYKQLQDLELRQVQRVVRLERLKDFAISVRKYIEEKNLRDLITVEEEKFTVRVTPLAPFLFKKGQDALTPEALPLLDNVAGFMKRCPSYVRIEGHTDSMPVHSPRFPSNWELSVARANSVMRYLMVKGIPVQRIEAIGYGEYQNVAPNDTPPNRAKNRRVVLEISPELEELSAKDTQDSFRPTEIAGAR